MTFVAYRCVFTAFLTATKHNGAERRVVAGLDDGAAIVLQRQGAMQTTSTLSQPLCGSRQETKCIDAKLTKDVVCVDGFEVGSRHKWVVPHLTC